MVQIKVGSVSDRGRVLHFVTTELAHRPTSMRSLVKSKSLPANGICLSLGRVNTIPTENKEGEDREKKTKKENYGGKENKGRQNGSHRQHEIQSVGVINATFHSLIQPPPTL